MNSPGKCNETRSRACAYKALGHPSRLLMVEALRERERCVGELTKLVGADVSTVSKHLSLMKSAGLVTAEKRGLNVFYHLCDRCLDDLAKHVGTLCGTRAKRERRVS
ncbi:MAG: winged helix-turn-helix transcriptional regulator [Verrucomicrobia bacterium]|nr:winged helix-turn-helix transcriptional regulator [Verrucomicrobiota bacterium]